MAFREFGAGVGQFYRTDFSTGEPFKVRNTNDLYRLIQKYDGVANCAISVYTFSKDDPDPMKRHMSAVFDVIAFDFDGDLRDTLDDLKKLKEKFLDKLHVEALFTFTGGRGFHVYLYFQPYQPKSNVKALLKYVQQFITQECELKTVDPQTFGDVGRLFRVPGTTHLKTGLYCTPLAQSEVFHLSLEEIKELAKKPRAVPVNKNNLKDKNDRLFKWLSWMDRKALKEIAVEREKIRKNMGKAASWMRENKEACEGILAAMEGVPVGKRDNTLVGLVYYMKLKGLDQEKAFSVLKKWANQCEGSITDQDLKYKIRYHYKKDSMPCGFIRKAGFCENCTMNYYR